MTKREKSTHLKQSDKKFGGQLCGHVRVQAMFQYPLQTAAPDQRQVGDARVALIPIVSVGARSVGARRSRPKQIQFKTS